MQHPWRQREHPFSSDLIALAFWFSQCTRYWLRADASQYLLYVIPFYGRFPLCLLCSFLRRPCARTGAAPFCPFGNTDGSAPAVILNTKFFRHMFLFVLKWQ